MGEYEMLVEGLCGDWEHVEPPVYQVVILCKKVVDEQFTQHCFEPDVISPAHFARCLLNI